MTGNNGFEDTPNNGEADKKPEEKELRGRYVKGNFGKAGAQPGRHADGEEGQYIGGDYGAAGSEGALPEPLGNKAKESGRYVKADYGDAGTAQGRTAKSEIGGYSKGDYGEGGTVDPVRKPAHDAEDEQ